MLECAVDVVARSGDRMGAPDEFGNKGVEHKLRHMGSDPKLIHAFPVPRPDLPESERVVDEIVGWFREHVPR